MRIGGWYDDDVRDAQEAIPQFAFGESCQLDECSRKWERITRCGRPNRHVARALRGDSLPGPTNGKVTCMTWGKLMGTLAAGAVVMTATSNLALAQQVAPEGRVYVFHSPKTGPCPELDWHVVVGANNALGGMVAWNGMKSMANVNGTISPNRTFTMNGKEVGGQGRTATITGQLRQDGYLIANVKGPSIECQGITVPWFTAPPQGGQG